MTAKKLIEVQDWAGYQPSNPSTSGIHGVIIKATEGHTFINDKMAKQTATARTAGLALGFYHFVRNGNMEQQAEFFAEKCLSLPGDSLWLDWEDPEVSCAEKDAFLHHLDVIRPDHVNGLYCNLNYWYRHDTTSFCGKANALWIAAPSAPKGMPGIQHPWVLHQYGISGNVDQNVAKFESRQAMKDWQGQYLKHTAPAKPKPVHKPAPKPKIPAFPGRSHFRLGHSDHAVTQLGVQLKKKGYDKHHDGHHGYNPGPTFTRYDLDNVRDFQRAHKELRGDADGYPGPITWKLLFS
jgi:hypothetical protein